MTQKPQSDLKVAATTRIWGITVGILAVCIPLSAVTRSGPILPLAAIGGAAAGTFAVWRDDKKSPSHSLSRRQVELLEQRIANLETIISSDDLELHRKIQQLESSKTHNLPHQSPTPEHKS